MSSKDPKGYKEIIRRYPRPSPAEKASKAGPEKRRVFREARKAEELRHERTTKTSPRPKKRIPLEMREGRALSKYLKKDPEFREALKRVKKAKKTEQRLGSKYFRPGGQYLQMLRESQKPVHSLETRRQVDAFRKAWQGRTKVTSHLTEAEDRLEGVMRKARQKFTPAFKKAIKKAARNIGRRGTLPGLLLGAYSSYRRNLDKEIQEEPGS